jgi:hypothetical protein
VEGLSSLAGYKKLRELLGEMFSQAYELAVKRLLAGKDIFHDRENKPLFSEELIFAALLIAHAMVAKLGLQLRLTDREKRIWRKRFIAAALLILCLYFNYFGDRDHDGIPDLIERLIPAALSCLESLIARWEF